MAQPPEATVLAMVSILVIATGCGQPATRTGAPTSAPSEAPARSLGPAASAAAVPSSPPLELLWEAHGDTEVSGSEPATYSPAIDPLTGDIWVAVSFDGIIWIFTEDGEYKGSFGKPGHGEGEFDFERSTCRPCGAGALAFAPDGSLFVADTGNNRVQKFDAQRDLVATWGAFGVRDGQFVDANQIATNGREVFVSDDGRLDTQVFTLDGTFVRRIQNAGWLATDPEGNLLISHEGTVTRYAPDGASLETIQLPDYRDGLRIGLAADDRGRLFFDFQRETRPNVALGLGALDPASGEVHVWSTGGETLAIAGDVVYMANFVVPGWPEPVLRAYALPG